MRRGVYRDALRNEERKKLLVKGENAMVLVKHCWACNTDYGPNGPLLCRYCRIVLGWVHVNPETKSYSGRKGPQGESDMGSIYYVCAEGSPAESSLGALEAYEVGKYYLWDDGERELLDALLFRPGSEASFPDPEASRRVREHDWGEGPGVRAFKEWLRATEPRPLVLRPSDDLWDLEDVGIVFKKVGSIYDKDERYGR